MDNGREANGNTARNSTESTTTSDLSQFVAKSNVVESIDFVGLQSNWNREVRPQVPVDLGGMAKGNETELSPFLEDVFRNGFVGFPFVDVGFQQSLADFTSPFGDPEVGFLVVRRVLKERRNTMNKPSSLSLSRESQSYVPNPASTWGPQTEAYLP